MKKSNFLKGISLLVFIVLLGFLIWAKSYYRPMDEAYNSLKSNEDIIVNTSKWLNFKPITSKENVGFIFYPGGKVDPKSYAPMARDIALEGYEVFIVPMPLNLAVFGYKRGDEVISENSHINKWVIGGHSLGGVMAANYLYDNKDKFHGLILLGGYPPKSKNLSDDNIDVLSIYALKDGLVSKKKISDSKELLPENTVFSPIRGGNHSQFGWYGFQRGDNKASISRTKQQKIIVSHIVKFLDNIGGKE